MKIEIAAAALLLVAAVLMIIVPVPEGRVYDCGMADWHPDIPTKVRELCQKRTHLK